MSSDKPKRRRKAPKPKPKPDPQVHHPVMNLEAMTVLAIDASKHSTGFARFEQGNIADYGYDAIGGKNLLDTMERMKGITLRYLVGMGPNYGLVPTDLVLIEDANMQPGIAHRIYEALYLGILGAASIRSIPVGVVSNTQVKMYTLGKGKWRGTGKPEMVDAVRHMYPLPLERDNPHHGDIADAIGVYLAGRAVAAQGFLKREE